MTRWLAALSAALLLVGCTGMREPESIGDDSSAGSASLTVSAASSLTDVMPQLIADFQSRNPQVRITANFAGSSTLVEQLLAGAPVDVIATASEATLDKAVEAGLVAQPQVIARNSMAVVVPAGNPGGVSSLEDLQRPDLLVGLCEVSVPCGAAAAQVISASGVSINPVTQELDVRALLGKVVAGDLDAGLVYVTDARSAGQQVEVIAVPDSVNAVTEYPVSVVRNSTQQAWAQRFVDYLTTEPAQSILSEFGFRAVQPTPMSAS